MTAEPLVGGGGGVRGRASRRLFAAGMIGRTANEMTPVAVVLLVLGRGEGATLAGITVAALAFSGVASGPLLGAWLDRARRPLRVIGAEQAVGAAGLATLALVVGHVPAAVTVAIAALTGALQPLSTGGMTSLVTGYSADEDLPRATSVEASSFGAASIAGPVLAAIIVGVESAVAAVLVQSGLKLVAMAIGLSTPEARRPRGLPAGPGRGSIRATLGAGARHFATAGSLAAITACGAIAMAGRGLLTVAFPFFAVESLGHGDEFTGYLWGAFAIGSALGAIGLSPVAVRRWPAERVVLGGVALAGLTMLSVGLAGGAAIALALLALSGAVYGPSLAATFDLRRRLTPADLLGQVFTIGASVKTASLALGTAGSGALVGAIGPAETIAAAAAIHVLASAVGAVMLRARRG